MQLSNERIQEFKDILEKKAKKEVSWEEAVDGARNLANFAELMYELWVKDQGRSKKLKECPKGFHLEGEGYSCAICGISISNDQTWYDKWGIKCLVCQSAINKHIIPGSAAKNKDSWYSKYDLEDRFGIDRHALKRFIKEEILVPRIVPTETGRPHAYLFLIKDNKETLPPKKLTKSRMVKETKDGQDWFHCEPWYRFVDPHEHLKEYKIMTHLKVTSVKK